MNILLKILKNKQMRIAYLGWFSIALFYFYQYVLRAFPGAMQEKIRIAYHATAEQFGTLGFMYLLGYGLLQIPLGVIVDRIGVKKMSLYSIVICMIGSLLFGLTNHFWVAQLSRFIIGVGSASAFMCALKFIADHFTPGNRGFLMGATLAIGSFGSITLSHSIGYMTNELQVSWRDMLGLTAAMGFCVFLFISFFTKESFVKAKESDNTNPSFIWKTIKSIARNKHIVIYSILATGLYTPLAALADLWGSVFLQEKYQLSESVAASTTTNMYIGLIIGSLFLPWLSEKYHKLNEAIVICGVGVLVTMSLIIYGPTFTPGVLQALLILLGVFCGAEMMCFTGALFFAKPVESGQVIGVVNTVNMLGGAVVQYIIGFLLDKQWSGSYTESGIRHYSTAQFEYASSILTVIIIVCCVVSIPLLKLKMKDK